MRPQVAVATLISDCF